MVTQFSANRLELLGWLQAISKSFTFSDQLHNIFKCVVITLDPDSQHGEGLQLRAADGISYVHITGISHEIDYLCRAEKSDGEVAPDETVIEFALEASGLLGMLSASNKQLVVFQFDHRTKEVIIKTESRYKVGTVDASLFPMKPKVECEMQSLESFEFLDVLDKLTPFAAKELVRPDLAGVTVAEKLYISTVGTFGAVHGRREDIFEQVTISPYVIKFLNSIVKSELKGVSFGQDENSFVVKGASFIHFNKLPVVTFPFHSLDSLMDTRKKFQFRALIRTDDFFSAVRRVLVLDPTDKFLRLTLNFSQESIKISYQNSAAGSVSAEEIPVQEIRLMDGVSEFEPAEICLGVVSVDAVRRLFTENEEMLMLTIIDDKSPLFFQQRGSNFMFYTQVMRKLE